MTQTVPVTDDGTRNFSQSTEVKFRIDHVGGPHKGEPEIFYGVPNMPALSLIEFAAAFDDLGKEEKSGLEVQSITKILEISLTDDSFARIMERMRDKIDPVGMNQLMDLVPWLMEKFGMRPPQPSAPSLSSVPNPDGGTNSAPSVSSAQDVTSQTFPPVLTSTSST